MPDELAQKARAARQSIHRLLGGIGVDDLCDFGDPPLDPDAERISAAAGLSGECPPFTGAEAAAELFTAPAALEAQRQLVTSSDADEPPPASRLAELYEAIGYTAPRARDLELKAEHEEKKRRDREDARKAEALREIIRADLGEFTKNEKKRLEQLKPSNADEEKDATHLGRTEWAICRQGSSGSLRDLAYAITRMLTLAPVEAVGCWVVECMGIDADGTAERQLYSPKARRKLVRSFALWRLGRNDRLRHIAGSLSRRLVRAVTRCPQKFLARIAAIGDIPWSRSTTARDATESHRAGLFRRVRLPQAIAPACERSGPSGQVVSRYWMELPRQPKPKSRFALPEPIGGVWNGAGVADDPLGWVREHAKNAIVYALHAVTLRRRRKGELVLIPGMLAPLQHAPP